MAAQTDLEMVSMMVGLMAGCWAKATDVRMAEKRDGQMAVSWA